MKQIIFTFLAFLLALMLCACESAINGASVGSKNESAATDNSDPALDDISESKGESENTSESESNVSEEASEDDEDILSAEYSFSAGENTVYLIRNANFEYELWIKYKDGEKIKIYADSCMATIEAKASPDGKMIAFSNYEWECGATVFLYYVDSREKVELEMTDIPEGYVPYYLDWHDDTHLMFNIIMDCGTVAIGGDVYIYNTESKNAKKIISAESDRLQIMSFERDNDNYRFKAGYYDEGYAEYEVIYYEFPFSEIEALTEDGEIMINYADREK